MAGAREEPLQGANTNYEKIKDLNKGAHGFVQLCRDKRTNRLVAVKFIERGDKVTHYVQREIMNHRSLNHPHVIEFREVFLTPKYLGIAMEYAAGGDMFDYVVVRQKRLKEQFARWFFQQLIVALDYCHRKGVANRDIKLENTLLDHNAPPLLKLCDFGYSKNYTAGSAPRSLVGTPAYLAPEVICSIRGTTYDGQAADVWSSGVMLYVMLVGGYPFERQGDNANGQALRKMYERIQAVDYHVPPQLGLSQECHDLLARILVADPSKRITIPQIFQHPWFTKDLPEGVLRMNDHPEQLPTDLQPEEEIKRILEEARQPHEGNLLAQHLALAPDSQGAGAAAGANGGAGGGGGTVWDIVDEYVDDALMHPHHDMDQDQAGAGAVLFTNDAARQLS